MGIASTLSNEVQAWGVLAIVIVVISVVLLKLRNSDAVCSSSGVLGNETTLNATSGVCCFTNTSGSFCGVSSSTPSLYTNVGTFVDALAEPKNWVAIVVIALIGFALLKLFRGKKNA